MNQSDPNGHLWDTVIDIGLIAVDLGFLAYDEAFNDGKNRTENIASLSANAIGAVTPFATGLGIAARASNKVTKTPAADLPTREFLEKVATKADKAKPGTGRFAGTAKHKYAKDLIEQYKERTGKKPELQTEKTFFNRQSESYGKRGSSRFDVIDTRAKKAYDYKFGKQTKIRGRQQRRAAKNLPRDYRKSMEMVTPSKNKDMSDLDDPNM